MAKRAAQNGHAIDIFAGCLDQVGLLEMKALANFTNGNMVLADSFQMGIFKQSFQKIFGKDENGDLQMGFNATVDVQTTKELKVSGLIGHAISANKKSGCVSETEIGIGGTSACGPVHLLTGSQAQATPALCIRAGGRQDRDPPGDADRS